MDRVASLGFPTEGKMAPAAPPADLLARATAGAPAAGRLFIGLLRHLRAGRLTLVLPGGESLRFGASAETLAAELHLRDWRCCARILRAGDIGFAEALRRGWVDSPDLTALLRLAMANESAIANFVWGGPLARLWYRLRHALRRNSRTGSRENIHAHYDIGNDFYGLWLDPTWTYSSALFRGDYAMDLEAAQRAKYQRVIEALGLRPGMRVLEIGCGWGGFAQHAAERGIAVHGITISPAQLAFARQRLARAGLAQAAQLELRDYRDLGGRYDAVVSIEMFEAVGCEYWDGWFRRLHALLAPGGRALVQSITIEEGRFEAYRASSDFIRHYIFPGGMLPSITRFTAAAARARLATSDILAFGRDYAETLRRWRRAFDAAELAIRAQGFDDVFLRTWRLYLSYCEAGFDEGRTDVVQFVLQRQPA